METAGAIAFQRHLPSGQVRPGGVGIAGLEHQSRQPLRMLPARAGNVRLRRFDADQFQIVIAEDGQVIAGSQRMVAAVGQLESQPAKARLRLVQLLARLDDDVVDA
ncbi:hypothetical protein D3C87_1637850 [compost metagenome]